MFSKYDYRYLACVGALMLCATTRIATAAAGDLDAAFGASGKLTIQLANQQRDFVRAVIAQPDGKVLLGAEIGEFSGTTNKSALVRLNSNGILDPTFGNGGKVVNSGQLHLADM